MRIALFSVRGPREALEAIAETTLGNAGDFARGTLKPENRVGRARLASRG